MSRIIPLWRSAEISLHRFDHPPEHEDQPYEETAASFHASFVEYGTFDLHVGEGRWRVGAGDVMLAHPGMRYRRRLQWRRLRLEEVDGRRPHKEHADALRRQAHDLRRV